MNMFTPALLIATLGLLSAQASDSTAPPVRRTTEAAMNQQVTAKDLIGRKIYDRQGKQVGEVVDVALGGVVPEELKRGLAQSDRDSYAASGVAPAPGDESGRQQQPDPAKASDRELDAMPTKERVHSSATSTVFVSVGGFLGMGADLIRVPLSSLSYDTRHERIVINLTQDELRSVTEKRISPDSSSQTADM